MAMVLHDNGMGEDNAVDEHILRLLTGDPVQPASFNWEPCGYTLLSDDAAWRQCSLSGDLEVHMERTPHLSGSTFRWHRNCKLPKLRVAVSQSLPPAALEGAAILLSAVTLDVLTNTARSVGLDGVSLRPLVHREACFASLAFKSTSYNLPGCPPMHLMVSLLLREPTDAGSAAASANGAASSLIIACSVLSPAITVDARKRHAASKGAASALACAASASAAAAASGSAAANRPSSTDPPTDETAPPLPPPRTAPMEAMSPPSLLPFAPQLLDAQLHKVSRESSAPVAIDNSVDGLRAYLSALNIRNKCKHPLFLVLRFDSCLGLLYDVSAVRNPAEDENAFYALMAAVGGGSQPSQQPTGSGPAAAPFVIALKGDHDGHACQRSECPVRLSAGLSLPHASSLPATYTMLDTREVIALRRMYCRLHCAHATARHPALTRPVVPLLAHERAFPPPPPLCHTCNIPNNNAVVALPHAQQPSKSAQRHASTILATANQMAALSCTEPDPGNCCGPPGLITGSPRGIPCVGGCPEREWQETLHILAEAMAMHCRTRTAGEIVAFIHDELTSGTKRAATDRRLEAPQRLQEHLMETTTPQPAPINVEASYSHDHANPTVGFNDHCPCDEFGKTLARNDAQAPHSHDHVHALELEWLAQEL